MAWCHFRFRRQHGVRRDRRARWCGTRCCHSPRVVTRTAHPSLRLHLVTGLCPTAARGTISYSPRQAFLRQPEPIQLRRDRKREALARGHRVLEAPDWNCWRVAVYLASPCTGRQRDPPGTQLHSLVVGHVCAPCRLVWRSAITSARLHIKHKVQRSTPLRGGSVGFRPRHDRDGPSAPARRFAAPDLTSSPPTRRPRPCTNYSSSCCAWSGWGTLGLPYPEHLGMGWRLSRLPDPVLCVERHVEPVASGHASGTGLSKALFYTGWCLASLGCLSGLPTPPLSRWAVPLPSSSVSRHSWLYLSSGLAGPTRACLRLLHCPR